MRPLEVGRRARVHDLGALSRALEDRLEAEGRERALHGRVERRALLLVELGVVGEVGGRFALLGGEEPHEVGPRHGLERVVEPPLLAESGDALVAQRLPAGRARAVSRVDERRVGEREELPVERVVELSREVGRRDPRRGEEVRAPHVAQEERVAREHGVRPCVTLDAVEDEDRDRLGRVARRLERLEPHAGPEVEPRAVLHGLERVLRARARPEVDPRAAAVAELEVAGHEVGVEVREEDVTDRDSVPGRQGDVFVHVASRVHDSGDLRLLVGDEIRRVGEATEVELLEDHESSGRRF